MNIKAAVSNHEIDMEHVSRQRNIPFGTVHKKMFKKNTQA
jgi:hypothetical protein